MVLEIKEGDRTLYKCEVCGFAYETREIAQECEDFCKTHNSCSMKITKLAIPVAASGEEGEKLD